MSNLGYYKAQFEAVCMQIKQERWRVLTFKFPIHEEQFDLSCYMAEHYDTAILRSFYIRADKLLTKIRALEKEPDQYAQA